MLASVASQRCGGQTRFFEKELANPICNFISHPAEDLPPDLLRRCSWVSERPMKNSSYSSEDGARLLGTVAHGNNIVKRLASKFIHTFRTVRTDIDPQLLHDLNSHGIESSWIGPGAMRLEVIARN
jgi:hypothetical protein